MAGSAPHIPEDDIEAAAQQNVQDENARTKSDGRSLSDPAQPIHQLPEDHMEAEAQQPVQAEKPSADDDKCSHGDEVPELTYNQMLYEFINTAPAGTRLANTFLYFDNLSRVNLLYLMNELAKYEQAMQKDKTAPQDMEQLGDLLHRYSKSVKVAIVIVFSLRCLHVSYRCSGPRILVQTPHARELAPEATAKYVSRNLS